MLFLSTYKLKNGKPVQHLNAHRQLSLTKLASMQKLMGSYLALTAAYSL